MNSMKTSDIYDLFGTEFCTDDEGLTVGTCTKANFDESDVAVAAVVDVGFPLK